MAKLDQYFDRLHAYAYTIVRDNAQASDMVQKAFIKLWVKRGEVDFQNSGKSYLYKTVYHLSLNVVRDEQLRQSHNKKASGNISEFINPAETKEIETRIHSGIEKLPDRCKEVFVKSRFEGMKYSEIAKDMDISIKTVEAQMGKALRLLRADLSDLSLPCILFILFQLNTTLQ